MKFMLTFSLKPDSEKREESIARYRETGGLPLEGAKLLGRWTRADLSGGYDLIESDDALALAEFSLLWSDVMELRIVPVIEDAELSELLRRAEN
jgi:hypothetical protein